MLATISLFRVAKKREKVRLGYVGEKLKSRGWNQSRAVVINRVCKEGSWLGRETRLGVWTNEEAGEL